MPPSSLLKKFLLIFQFYLKCFCEAFSIFPWQTSLLLCPCWICIMYLCSEAIVYYTDLLTCFLLNCKFLKGRDWNFVCSHSAWFSIHPNSSVCSIYTFFLSSLLGYFRWFQNMASDWKAIVKPYRIDLHSIWMKERDGGGEQCIGRVLYKHK